MALESAWANAESKGMDTDYLFWILPRSLPGSKDVDADHQSATDCMLAVLRQLFSHHPNSDHPCLKGQDSEEFSGLAAETIRLAMSNFIVKSREDQRKIDAVRTAYTDARLAQDETGEGTLLTFAKLRAFLADLWESSPDFDLYNKPIGRKRPGIDKYWEPLPANKRKSLYELEDICSTIEWNLSETPTFYGAFLNKFGTFQVENGTLYCVDLGKPLFLVVKLDPQGVKPQGFDINTIGRLQVPNAKRIYQPVPGNDTLEEVIPEGYDNLEQGDEFRLMAVVRERASNDAPDYVRLYTQQGTHIPIHGDVDRCKHFTSDAWSLEELDHCYTLFYVRNGPATDPEHRRLMTEVYSRDNDMPPSQQHDLAIMTALVTPKQAPAAAAPTPPANMPRRSSSSVSLGSKIISSKSMEE